ncbi:MAG: hypothetical protein KKI09_12580 [Spirochaetes bacterium]|nr:hypothetical protein [Spirochaetota bacterium]MBU0956258.1 hypothetical protein [Spirochaetota bacterium]
MKSRNSAITQIVLIVSFLIAASSCVNSEKTTNSSAEAISTLPQQNIQPNTPRQGPYLGEQPPGAEPQRFGSGFISGQFHSTPTFSPDSAEVWWAGSFSSGKIFTSKLTDGTWMEPAVFRLPGNISHMRDPFISPDGQRFYFISMAALPDSNTGGKENIWMAIRSQDGWTEPVPLPPEINELTLHWTFSVAANYDLYFSAETGPYNNDIYLSRWANGKYQKAEKLPEPLNSGINEYTPNIAPDESYILFSRFEGNSDTPRLYISYASTTGWSEPVLVENIPYCLSPIISPDRKYLFFMSSASSFAWRDSAFIAELRGN